MRHLSTAIPVLAAAIFAAAPACAAQETKTENAAPAAKPDWDQVANIKDAAARIARLQKTKGVTAAYKFIDACYRTHTLAENYTAGFEACMAQDLLQTKMLVEIYARTPPETLRKYGSPTPQALAETVNRRVSGALAQYKISAEKGLEFRELVDKHGLPIFVGIVFPEAIRELEQRGPKPGREPAPQPAKP